ncbi:hypothetical protein J3R82DRAFT_1011 [Butyriboletus roseoflavus]|nr:hypothetical protein J3R82DRAFT_1011 [Butyriboletus roseoflavus]
MLARTYLIFASLEAFLVLASPPQETFVSNNNPYDVQAHRGGRGNTVESTLPSFAWYAGVCDICMNRREIRKGGLLTAQRL